MRGTARYVGGFAMMALTGWFLISTGSAIGSQNFERNRARMVERQIAGRGISDPEVLKAMETVPRHRFVPDALRARAYDDSPLPIGDGQTISQPYIVALMTESLGLSGDERVLEIGTGSGYQAAVLAEIVPEVHTIEIKPGLHRTSAALFREMELDDRIRTREGDGYFGWPEAAPFDAIMITAAADHIPPPLLGQLRDGGRLILPLGNPFSYQNLVLATKTGEDIAVRQITGVLFVPMTGRAMERAEPER
jgi:protein-L-isoaspartate(D-aspartate) O-methyltransferase